MKKTLIHMVSLNEDLLLKAILKAHIRHPVVAFLSGLYPLLKPPVELIMHGLELWE